MHRHSREDEYSYVLGGRVGAKLGQEVVYGQAGELTYKCTLRSLIGGKASMIAAACQPKAGATT
jgi:hypothetical protein